jgi:hypothetical protein
VRFLDQSKAEGCRASRNGEYHENRGRTRPNFEPVYRGACTGSSDKRFALADEE